MKKLTEIKAVPSPEDPKPEPNLAWEVFTANHLKSFPAQHEKMVASGEWEGKVKTDFLANLK